MSAVLRPLSQARQPLQQRAVTRFERVLKEADALLLEAGLGGFSIPALADRLGYTRASIYKFFPTPYAVLNELARRYLARLEDALAAKAPQMLAKPWEDAAVMAANHAANFYDRHPVASVLLLGGPLTDDGYRAQEITIHRLGELIRGLFRPRGIELPTEPVDVATLTVEVGTACFRLSYFRHGRITAAYRAEAGRAMVAYLTPHVAAKAGLGSAA